MNFEQPYALARALLRPFSNAQGNVYVACRDTDGANGERVSTGFW